jgi:hypothetical protein
MKRRLSILLSALCLLALTSCSRAIVLQVFNNTGVEVKILANDGHQEQSFSVAQGQSQRIKAPLGISVLSGGNSWQYDVKPVPKTKQYMISETFGPLVIKLQLQPDGSVHVLPPTAQGTQDGLPAQPPGYPLIPAPKTP